MRRLVQRSFGSPINDEIAIDSDRDNKQFVESFRARGRFEPFLCSEDSDERNLRFAASLPVARDRNAG